MLSELFSRWESCPVHFSSVKVQADRSLIAASLGQGVFQRPENGEWSKLSEGLPEGTSVNRLQVIGSRMFACTSTGLYTLQDSKWQFAGIDVACYQYKEEWGYSFAATQKGLLYRKGDTWYTSAHENAVVYDFLFTPHYLYIGMQQGIATYDRMMDKWAAFKLGVGVTSLAADRGRLIGASDKGELVVGNRHGSFEKIRFGDMFVFAVITKAPSVYVCTDKGLFRLTSFEGRTSLFSVKPGVPVTDIDWHGSDLFMATLSRGIQTMRA